MIKTSTWGASILARLHGLQRELGIVTNDSAIVKDVNAVVTRDYSGCTAATDCSNYD